MRFDHVIFDFDGTLCDTGPGIVESARYALERMRRDAEDSVLRKFVGPPLESAFRELCGMTAEEAAEAARLFREHYRGGAMYRSAVYPGMRMLLRALKRYGVHAAVVSGKNEWALRRQLEHFRLSGFFECVSGGDPAHPDADKSRRMLGVLPEGIDMERVCVVGDRRFDVDSARAAGAHSIMVGYGYGDAGEISSCGPDETAADVGDLYSRLLGDAPKPRGRLITFEGTDGCGKSTQIGLTAEWLRSLGEDVVLTREPGGCPISERIREVILSLDSRGMSAECEALLYAAARIEHVREVILPQLEAGRVVLCDRFLDSSIAYQAWGRELGEDFIRQINSAASEAVVPDVTVLLSLSREKAKKRMENGAPPDRLEMEEDAFFERLNEGYCAVAAREPERVHVIDATGTVEEIFERICPAVLPEEDG